MSVSTLWSLSLTLIIVGVIVMIHELKNGVSRQLSCYLTMIGSIIAIIAVCIDWYHKDFVWFDVIILLIMLNGIRTDINILRSKDSK